MEDLTDQVRLFWKISWNHKDTNFHTLISRTFSKIRKFNFIFILDSWGNLSRRSQTFGGLGKENTAPSGIPAAILAMPPPALCEETLMAPEHNEILAKLKYISVLVDKIIEVARHKVILGS